MLTGIFVGLVVIWACYTAALIIGGIIASVAGMAITFFTIWEILAALAVGVLVLAIISELIWPKDRGGKA